MLLGISGWMSWDVFFEEKEEKSYEEPLRCCYLLTVCNSPRRKVSSRAYIYWNILLNGCVCSTHLFNKKKRKNFQLEKIKKKVFMS